MRAVAVEVASIVSAPCYLAGARPKTDINAASSRRYNGEDTCDRFPSDTGCG